MNIENYSIRFLDAPNIIGVLMFLAVKYEYRRERILPCYKGKDLKSKNYGK